MTFETRRQELWAATGLFLLLCFFTLTTLDGGPQSQRVVSIGLFLAAATYLLLRPAGCTFHAGLAPLILLGMAAWGAAQTLFFPRKIVSLGWDGVLFWFAAAVIAFLAQSAFQQEDGAEKFREAFVYFASGICVLGLLQRATHTTHYFWLVASRYDGIFGTFAYANNFAQLIEMALPITLWAALGDGKPKPIFLTLGAIQIAAVLASGSRAGSLLLAGEAVVILMLIYRRAPTKHFLAGAATAIACTAVLIYAAGAATLLQKFKSDDPWAVRGELNQSSLAMLAEHPVAGWGLDTYVPVYRMFARYDDGTYVNQAHNDWLQFAVEGGLPFATAMAILFIWSVRPALGSGWGVGVIGIGLHAMVDYPFARLGVCGWYFAWLSMLSCESAYRIGKHRFSRGRY